MIISTTIDPSAFDIRNFSRDGYRLQAEKLLEGINDNGVVLVDSNGLLQSELENRIKSLPIKYRQKLLIYYEYLVKEKKRRRILKCKDDDCPPLQLQDSSRLAKFVAERTKVDGLVVGQENPQMLSGLDNVPVDLGEYSDSNLEQMRHRFIMDVSSLDTLSSDEVRELFRRVIRYSKTLRFYDKQIGKGSRLGNFVEGISFVLDQFRANRYFNTDVPMVEIVTSGCAPVYRDDIPSEVARKNKDNQEARELIIRHLIEPLLRRFRWDIGLKFKNDEKGIFHARHLEAQFVVVSVERGFDFFDDHGNFRRNFIKVDKSAAEHLRECRDLPEAIVEL